MNLMHPEGGKRERVGKKLGKEGAWGRKLRRGFKSNGRGGEVALIPG